MLQALKKSMLNFNKYRNEKDFKKETKKNIKKNSLDFEEVSRFYNMLLKYKNFHPCFNIKKVMLQVYPNLDWEQISSKIKFYK